MPDCVPLLAASSVRRLIQTLHLLISCIDADDFDTGRRSSTFVLDAEESDQIT